MVRWGPWALVHSIRKILDPNILSARELVRQWKDEVLRPYSSRRLTKPTDKLVALSALASLFQARFKGNYLAGLWREDLLRELLWVTRASDKGRSESSDAPSWSWASASMNGQWGPSFNDLRCPEIPLAQVLEASTHPSTINKFGPVSRGVIKLSAITFPATVDLDNDDRLFVMPNADLKGIIDVVNLTCEFDTPLAPSNVTLEDGTRERVLRRLKADEGGYFLLDQSKTPGISNA
ncbi:hypothetical protein Daus18300_003540 [Diaporthe australafricana]|uniref:Uncharacterized protein n=1 Tax=Diaporthe australafricana TaxID=127596 RepID=A0ABR3XEY0_9PEZI